VMGDREPLHFAGPPVTAFDAWDAKALAERAARVAFPGADVVLRPTDGDDDRLWSVLVAGEERGQVRRIPLDAPVWAKPAFGVELVLGAMSNNDVAPPGEHAHGTTESPPHRRPTPYRPLPSTPAAEFDLALVLPPGVTAARVDEVIRSAAGELLERLAAFDQYEGNGVEAGHRSVAWRLTLRHPERTLRDKEIEGRRTRILSALQQELNVRQRTS
jgi:phenylalanyl-tRNA synthetase beta chain